VERKKKTDGITYKIGANLEEFEPRTETESEEICPKFALGHCPWGQLCRFRHVIPKTEIAKVIVPAGTESDEDINEIDSEEEELYRDDEENIDGIFPIDEMVDFESIAVRPWDDNVWECIHSYRDKSAKDRRNRNMNRTGQSQPRRRNLLY